LVFYCNGFRTSAFSYFSALRIRDISGKTVAIALTAYELLNHPDKVKAIQEKLNELKVKEVK